MPKDHRDQSGPVTIYLIRHGESEGNLKNIALGQRESPLTQKGREQALALSSELKRVRFDAVFSSDLSRAYDTAKIIADERSLPVSKTALLRERFVGASIEGRQADDVGKQLSDQLAEFKELSNREKLAYKFTPDMESGDDVFRRFLGFLKGLIPEYEGKTILCISHAALIGSILVTEGVVDYKGPFASEEIIDNIGYVKISFDGENVLIDNASDISAKGKV